MLSADAAYGSILDAWFERLDRAAFHVGVRERLVVQALLVRIAVEGELSAPRMLELARPLLCTQPQQQRDYAVLQQQFLEEMTAVSNAGTAPSVVEAAKPGQYWGWIGFLVLLLIIAGGYLTGRPVDRGDPPSQQTAPPVTTQSEVPSARPIYVPVVSLPIDPRARATPPAWSKPLRMTLLAVGGVSLIGLGWLAWSRWRRQLYLQGTRTDCEVEERLLTDPAPVSLAPPGPLTRRAARGLRQRYAGERETLDVTATLRATMAACGGWAPRYAVVKQTPEYLALIDRRHPADHHALYSEALLNALTASGVTVQSFYFEGSPQTGCWRLRGSGNQTERFDSVSFTELAARYAGHRLLVFAEAQAFLDEASGGPRSWTRHLSAFPQRGWLTPMPLSSWGRSEQQLDLAGFLVLPVQPEALNTLAGWFSAGQLGLLVGSDWPLSFPPLLRDSGVSWVVRRQAPAAATLDDLLFELRAYLGPLRFQWLCACAIFPATSLPVTLALGRRLTPDPRQLALGVAAIGALPWFRHGFMPSWLRLKLIEQLQPEHEATFREVIERRLADAIEGTGTVLLGFAQRERRLAAWFQRRRGPARDLVLVDFVHRGPLQRLAQRLPETLRKRLFRDGVAAYGINRKVTAALLLGALGGSVPVLGAWDRVVEPEARAPWSAIVSFADDAAVGASYLGPFSPDGRQIVIREDSTQQAPVGGQQLGGVASTVRIWSFAESRWQHAFKANEVFAVEFSSNLRSVLANSRLAYSRSLWSTSPWQQSHELLSSEKIRTASFAPDGSTVAIVGDTTVSVWSTATGTLQHLLKHPAALAHAAFSPDSQNIVTASADGAVRVWALRSGAVTVLLQHGKDVYHAEFDPRGKELLSVGEGVILIWSMNGGAPLREIPCAGKRRCTVSYRPGGHALVVTGGKQPAALWSTAGKKLADLGAGELAAFSPDGEILALLDEAQIDFWRVSTGEMLGRMPGSEIHFSPDGRRLAISDGAVLGLSIAPAVDLLECKSATDVAQSTIALADLLASSKGISPERVEPVAYVPASWTAPMDLAYPDLNVIYYGTAAGAKDAEQLRAWFEKNLPSTGSPWTSKLQPGVGAGRFVVNVCRDQESSRVRESSDELLEAAEQEIVAERFDKAVNYIERARQIDPNSPRLNELDAQFALARKQSKVRQAEEIRSRVRRLVDQAYDRMKAGRLLAPAGVSARDSLTEARRLDPADSTVAKAIRELSSMLVERAREAATAEEFRTAQNLIREAKTLGVSLEALDAAQKFLTEKMASPSATVRQQSPVQRPPGDQSTDVESSAGLSEDPRAQVSVRQHIVTVRNKAFSIASLQAKVGDTVTFRNEDEEVTHNIFSLGPRNAFDLKTLEPGVERSVKLAEAGTVDIECTIHTKERLKLTVKP